MIKNNKTRLFIASLITVLPAIFGTVFWNRLPDVFTIHFSASGTADGFSSKAFAVFGLPLILLCLFWLCIFITAKDPVNKHQNKKAFRLVIWIVPVISVFTNAIIWAVSFDYKINGMSIMSLMMGLMFLTIGNYMPKCKQNFTIGVKVKWTLQNEENWNATHRFSGKIWVVGGLVIMLCALLPETFAAISLFVLLLPLVIAPVIYSYRYHKKQVKNGIGSDSEILKSGYAKKYRVISMFAVGVILIFIAVIMFTGSIKYEHTDSSFSIKATYWQDILVEYDDIDSVKFIEDFNAGKKINGFNSARLLLGTFENNEFGRYTVFAYTRTKSAVVITSDGKTLVINDLDKQSTKEIYEKIADKINNHNH